MTKDTAPPVPDEFATRLADKRRETSPNLTAFARQTVAADPEGKGISRSALLEYERGSYRPGTRELRILCNALRVTPNFLIYGTEEPFATMPQALRAIQKNAANASKEMAVMAVAVFIACLEEDQLTAHLRLLEDSVKARKTPEEFAEMMAGLQALSEQTDMFEKMGRKVAATIENDLDPATIEKVESRKNQLMSEKTAATVAK